MVSDYYNSAACGWDSFLPSKKNSFISSQFVDLWPEVTCSSASVATVLADVSVVQEVLCCHQSSKSFQCKLCLLGRLNNNFQTSV